MVLAVQQIRELLQTLSQRSSYLTNEYLTKWDARIQWVKSCSENLNVELKKCSRKKKAPRCRDKSSTVNSFRDSRSSNDSTNQAKRLLEDIEISNSHEDCISSGNNKTLLYVEPEVQKDSLKTIPLSEEHSLNQVSSNAITTSDEEHKTGDQLIKEGGILSKSIEGLILSRTRFPSLYSSEISSGSSQCVGSSTDDTATGTTEDSKELSYKDSMVDCAEDVCSPIEEAPFEPYDATARLPLTQLYETPDLTTNEWDQRRFNGNVQRKFKITVKGHKLDKIRSRLKHLDETSDRESTYSLNISTTILRRKRRRPAGKNIKVACKLIELLDEPKTARGSRIQRPSKNTESRVKNRMRSYKKSNMRQKKLITDKSTQSWLRNEAIFKRKLSLQRKLDERRKKREQKIKQCRENREKLQKERSKLHEAAIKELSPSLCNKPVTTNRKQMSFSDAIHTRVQTFLGGTATAESSKIESRTSLGDIQEVKTKPATFQRDSECDSYDISPMKGIDTSIKKKRVPSWAKGLPLKAALIKQAHLQSLDGSDIFGTPPKDVMLDDIFAGKYDSRTSSSGWEDTSCSTRKSTTFGNFSSPFSDIQESR